MHPREGWKADGTPPPLGVSRRGFLRQGAAAGGVLLGAGGAGSLLAACNSSAGSGNGPSGGPTSNAIPLPRPNDPVTWPIFSDNKPLKSGLQPEKNATLKIFNWVAYINEAVVKDFCKKYNCKYTITTFENMD